MKQQGPGTTKKTSSGPGNALTLSVGTSGPGAFGNKLSRNQDTKYIWTDVRNSLKSGGINESFHLIVKIHCCLILIEKDMTKKIIFIILALTEHFTIHEYPKDLIFFIVRSIPSCQYCFKVFPSKYSFSFPFDSSFSYFLQSYSNILPFLTHSYLQITIILHCIVKLIIFDSILLIVMFATKLLRDK
jgi:hypothetical protein